MYTVLTFVAAGSLTLRDPQIDAAEANLLCTPALGEAQRVAVGAGSARSLTREQPWGLWIDATKHVAVLSAALHLEVAHPHPDIAGELSVAHAVVVEEGGHSARCL